MIKIIKYQCEICKAKYYSKLAAEHCEAEILPACPVNPGDIVYAYERYEKPKKDIVVSVHIGPSYFKSVLQNRALSDEEWEKFLAEEHKGIFHHSWKIEMKNHHQYSKDADAFSNIYDWSSVKLPKATTWLDGSKIY